MEHDIQIIDSFDFIDAICAAYCLIAWPVAKMEITIVQTVTLSLALTSAERVSKLYVQLILFMNDRIEGVYVMSI